VIDLSLYNTVKLMYCVLNPDSTAAEYVECFNDMTEAKNLISCCLSLNINGFQSLRTLYLNELEPVSEAKLISTK